MTRTRQTGHHLLRSLVFAAAAILVGVVAVGGHSALAPDRSVFETAMSDAGRIRPDRALAAITRVQASHARQARSRLDDLAGIKASGVLRVLVRARHEVSVAGAVDLRQALISRFCDEHGLQPVWVTVSEAADLPAALAEGRGDIILDDLPIEFDQDARLARTVTLASLRQLALVRESTRGVENTTDLIGRRVAIREDSPVFAVVEHLARAAPGIQLHVLPDYVGDNVLREGLRAHDFDIAIVSDNSSSTRRGLRVAFEVAPPRPRQWSVRESNPALLAALNHHLLSSPLLAATPQLRDGDLDAIRDSGVLRVITRRQRDNFFLDDGAAAGFEHEVIADFAREHGLRLRVVLADTPEQMRAALIRGQGDIISARGALPEAGPDSPFALSRAFHHVSPTLLMRADAAIPADRRSLGRLSVAWHPDLTDPLLVESLQRRLFEEAPRAIHSGSPQDALAALEDGRWDALIVDSHFLPRILDEHPQLKSVLSLDNEHPYRFAVRGSNRQLLSALDDYLLSGFRGEFYNILQRRYFERADFRQAPAREKPISRYDDIARRYGRRYGFDWRLILATAYEESRFNPGAVSDAGARGLMQLMPATAEQMGFRNLHDPDRGIHAGVAYLDWLRAQFEDSLPVMERNWFSLAAYNAGPGRVRAARREAQRLGLDPDRWFDHVEKVMLGFGRPAGEDGRGLCRCGQTVAYLRAIRSRYDAYLQLRAPLRYASVLAPTVRGS